MPAAAPVTQASGPDLGISPRGKTELEIDMSRIHNPELPFAEDSTPLAITSEADIPKTAVNAKVSVPVSRSRTA